MSKLVNIFAAGGASLLLAGCASPILQRYTNGDCTTGSSVGGGLFFSQSFDRTCADHKVASTMLASPNKQLQMVGAVAIRNQSPAIDKAFKDVQNGKTAPAPVKVAKTCTVTEVAQGKRKDGTVAHLDCHI
jgi:hypothetical protein